MTQRTRAASDEPSGRASIVRVSEAHARRLSSPLLALALALVTLAPPSTTKAQALDEPLRLRAFDLQLFTPPAAQGSTFLIERPEPLPHLSFSLGLHGNAAADTFQRFDADRRTPLVGPIAQVELLAALGLFHALEVGVAVPLVLGEAVGPDASGTRPNLGDPGASADSFQIGGSDVRLALKVPLLRGDFALAAVVSMGIPPCAGESCASLPWFASSRYWSFAPSLVASGAVGIVRVSGAIAYRLRQRRGIGDFIQDDELHLAAGAAVTIVPELEAILDVQYRVGLGGPLASGRAPSVGEMPLEIDVGGRLSPSGPFSVEAGIGAGVLAGYGAPLVRGFVTLRYRIDAGGCAFGPEDEDGFEDGDFCRDPDNDGDGIEDTVDRCPNDPEDEDGFEDEDGCPELDNDGDSIPDAADACPMRSEDLDGFEDEDGCPELDNDEDGVPDGLDRCPMDPEDRDGFEDEDGCPEPGPRAVAVTVSDTRILIGETIYFEFDTDVIRPVSMPLLDQVADVIGHLDPSLRIRVEGHTDDLGSDAYNVDLSFRRARAVVEYLVSRGVARDRLEYRGYGARHGVAPNDSPQGRALNRRVEFTILRPGEQARARERRGAR